MTAALFVSLERARLGSVSSWGWAAGEDTRGVLASGTADDEFGAMHDALAHLRDGVQRVIVLVDPYVPPRTIDDLRDASVNLEIRDYPHTRARLERGQGIADRVVRAAIAAARPDAEFAWQIPPADDGPPPAAALDASLEGEWTGRGTERTERTASSATPDPTTTRTKDHA